MARLRAILEACLAGWMASFIASVWFIVPIARINSFGDQHIFRHELYSGLILWLLWTFVLSLAPSLTVAIPLALLVPPRWMLCGRWPLTIAALLTAAAIPAIKFRAWSGLRHIGPWDPANFWPYLLFCTVYAAVVLFVYFRILRRHLRKPLPCDSPQAG